MRIPNLLAEPLAPVLESRNFARFMAGCSISNIGSWMQNVTVPFALYQLTGSATWVGVAGMAQFIPAVPLAPVAGALADRFDRRRVLLASQVVQGLASFALWLTWLWRPLPWTLVALVAIGGTALLVTSATQQAFVSQLVPERDLLRGLTLNSAQANLARAIGPALGGVILAVGGPSWAFLINTFSYVAVLLALTRIDVAPQSRPARHGRVLREFAAAVRYVRQTPGIALAMALTMTVGAAAFPVYQLAAVLVRDVYDVGPQAFGVLTGSFGVGAVIGAIVLGRYGGQRPRSEITLTALALLTGALFVYAASSMYVLGVACATGLGATTLVLIALFNTVIQSTSDPNRRGTVIALWIASYNVAFAVGALAMGLIADHLGARTALALAGVVVAVVTGTLLARPTLATALNGDRAQERTMRDGHQSRSGRTKDGTPVLAADRR